MILKDVNRELNQVRDVLDQSISYRQLCQTNLVRFASLRTLMSREHLAELSSSSDQAYDNIEEDVDSSDIRLLKWLGFMDERELVESK